MHRIRYPNILTLSDFIFFQMLILTITLFTDSLTKENDSFKFGLTDVTLFCGFSTPFPHRVVRQRIFFVIWNEMQYVYSRSEPPLCRCINIDE